VIPNPRPSIEREGIASSGDAENLGNRIGGKMKYLMIVLLVAAPMTAFASEICEISTAVHPYWKDTTKNVADINCTDHGIYEKFAHVYAGPFQAILETKRAAFKNLLLSEGYKPSTTCGTYESYIKP
jgi:hypothetical protein